MKRALALVCGLVATSTSAQLPIAPAPDGTVFVRVAGRGFVKRTSASGSPSALTIYEDPDGRTTWVEYDEFGVVVRWITQEPGAVVSGQALTESAAAWTTARDARQASHGNDSYRALTATEFTEFTCAGRPPALPGDVRWVLVATNADDSPPACANYILATSRFDPPDRAPDDVGTILYDLDGNEVARSPVGHTIALETSFFTPDPDAPGRCRERSDVNADPSLEAFVYCPPHNHHAPSGEGLRIWNPIAGAEVTIATGQSILSAYTNEFGYAELPFHRWQYVAGPIGGIPTTVAGFYFGEPIDLDFSLSDVSAFVRYAVFNPRSPSSRMTVLNRTPGADGHLFTQYANFAVDTAFLDAILEVRTFTPSGEARVPLVDTSYLLEEYTTFSSGEVSVAGYGAGLLTQLSAADLRDTDVYVFRESDGALVGSREGMLHSEVAGVDLDPTQYPGAYVPAGCRDRACLNVTMVTRGPASATNIGGGYGFDPARGRVGDAGGIDATYLRPDDTWRRFLRPGDAVRIVAINRASGYVGSLRTIVGILGGRVVIGHPGQRILLGPPSLRVFATRCYDDTSGGSPHGDASCGMGRENVITFEGAGTTGDHYVRIVTEWLDYDGTPLPEELPGFTGRISRSIGSGGLVPLGRVEASTEGDATGLFPIRPGRHTAVVQLPGADTRQHFYVHADGAPYERLADFTGRTFQGPSFDVNDVCYATESGWTCATKEGRDPSLTQRPADFVPLQVQVFDPDATRALAADRAAQLRDDWATNGGDVPVLGSVERVYAWRYSPEFQFSLYDLDVDRVDVITDGRGTHVDIDYDLDAPADDPLAGLGGDGGLVWGIGSAAIEAPEGTDVHVSTANAGGDSGGYPPIEALLEGSAGGEAQTLGEQVASLTPEDLLTLGLYDLDDPANPLFELDGLPLVLADVSPLFLERRYQTAWFDTRDPGLDGGPAYVDDYRVLPFVAFHSVDVTLRVVRVRDDGTDDELEELLTQSNLSPGLHHFVVTAADILDAGVNVAIDPRFVLELEAREIDPESGTPRTHRVRWSGQASVRHDNLKLGQTVVHDVLLQDGSLRLSRQDFAFGGLQPALQFSRNYTNIATESDQSPLGTGWSHSYDMTLVPLTSEEGTSGSMQSTPQWVRSLEGRFFRESEIPTLPRTWTGVAVNGTVFRKVGARWIPERGRHGLLEEVDGEFVFTSEDGTRYHYPQPSFAEPRLSVRADRSRISVTDPLFFRLGLTAPGREVTDGNPGAPPGSPVAEGVTRIVDRNGNTMTFAYDAERRVSLVTDATGRTLRFHYGRFPGGVRLLAVTALEGHVLQLTVQFEYDERGYLEAVTRDGRRETYAYLPEHGVIGGGYNLHSTTVTPDGVDMLTTVYEYHSAESLGEALNDFVAGFHPPDVVRSVTYPSREDEGDPDGPTATFAYENERRIVTNARGYATTYTLNVFGSPLRIEEPAAGEEGGGKVVEMDWTFEAGLQDNLMIARREIGAGRTGDPSYETRWTYTWDAATGRVSQVVETDARGNASTTTYDLAFGNVLTHSDRNGFTQTWTYDERGNLETHTDATLATWTYESYDNGLRRTVRAPGHLGVTSFTYDAHGNPERVTLPAVGAEPLAETQSTYDARGRLVASTDANGNTTTRDYDGLDNLRRVVLPELTQPEDSFPAGRGLSLRRLVEVTTTYDLLGRITTETDRNGLTLTYEHTARGQVKRVTRSFGDGEKLFRYDDSGNLVYETDWKGVETTHGYDALDRRTTSTNRRG
ncbi:MAG: RHS repeat protein, partial [Sandaracinus sp.]|nr:RHS repeat protein [Sandaracinus sp.]